MRAWVITAVTAAVALAAWLSFSRLAADERASAGAPTSSPTLLIDAGHHNFGMDADLAPLSKWLQANGYAVRALRGAFDAEALDGIRVVISKNALSERNAVSARPSEAELARAWSVPTPSAFTREEIAALHAWILGGGSLLLVFDHMPMPGAARELAAAFDVEVSNGHAVDERALRPFDPAKVERAGRAVFTRSDGSLADDPLTNGRDPSERVESVASDGGSAFRLPSHARSLLTLGPAFVSLVPETAWRFSEATPRLPVAGWSQGGVLRLGRGRLAVFGDGSILMSPAMAASVASWGGSTGGGATADFAQSPRLLLNVLRWLAGEADGG